MNQLSLGTILSIPMATLSSGSPGLKSVHEFWIALLRSSPCLLEDSSLVVQLCFLGWFLIQMINNVVVSRCNGMKNMSSSSEKYGVGAEVGFSYHLSILQIGTRFIVLLMFQSDAAGDRCNFKVIEIMHMICWAVSLGMLHKILNDRHVKLPWLLRIWWISSFLLSLASAVLDGYYVLAKHEKIDVRDFTDAANLFASTCLFLYSIRGESGIIYGGSAGITTPLLNGNGLDQKPNRLECLYGKASFFQKVTFSWLNPLFELGNKKTLDQDEVPDVYWRDSAHTLFPAFDDCLNRVRRKDGTSNPSIYKAVYLLCRKKAAMNAMYAVIYAVSSYVGPYLINDFVEFLNEKESKTLARGYLLALAFLTAKVVETILLKHRVFGSRVLGLQLRAALMSHTYQKGLVLSSISRQTRTSGEIINVMSVDVQRVSDFMIFLNVIVMLPIQISLAVYVLHKNLGMGSFVALAATLVLMAGNIPLTSIQKRFQTQIMGAKDGRMKTTSEVLRNMKTIKLQAWDEYFLQKIECLRENEYNWLWKLLKLQAVTDFIYWGSPIFISAVTFGGCVLLGIPLTAGPVLSALATFQTLQDPIFSLPELLSAVAQGRVSADRIATYLNEEEIQADAVSLIPENEAEFAIQIENGAFTWDDHGLTLDGINLEVVRGSKVAICGAVGSGKSSFLSCILGEMSKESGFVRICGTKAYVPQSAWILNGSIRDNILFGSPYDSDKYIRTVEACALVKDLELFSAGDQTEIGERGINMSGGQKQRIQIARAVYQDADIYLLDDPFSAVDAHTGTQLFQDCLMGILKEKTIVYVTHQLQFLPAADQILVMRNGRIAQAGSFDELSKHNVEFEVHLKAHNQALDSIQTVESSSRALEQVNEEFPEAKNDSENDLCEEETEKNGKLVQEEEREKGGISKQVYLTYFTMVKGGAFIPLILLAQSMFQVLQVGSNYWMAWACPVGNAEPIVGILFVLLVYVALAIGMAIFVLIRATLQAKIGLQTSQKLFDNMLRSVFRSPMAFFDSTPTGRILSRVSTDQSVMDLEMPNKLGRCGFSAILLIGTVTVMSQVAWEVFILFIPVTAICIWYQRYYMPTARQLSRLAGIQRAPILHHFAESLAGATTIRAFDQKNRFIHSNLGLIDNHSRPWYHNAASMEWLSFRLNQLSNLVFGFSLFLLVTLPQGFINPSIAGLAVSYGMSLNAYLAAVIWYICNVENNMISVERIFQYSNIPSEAPLLIEDCRPPENWPQSGTIEFRSLKIRYAEHLPLVLKNITCTFPGRKKIGVAGRTGSGKSTLIQALFRVIEPGEGAILIDQIDITKIGLHDLRSRLSIIPQDPTMFEGTVRSNLDPLQQYTDDQIWEALGKCQLSELVGHKPEKLESPVMENGENWSVGQRQLFCLGRAMLKKSTVLVLDEATASVDSVTDRIIQEIISREFEDRTVITIAHRIHTIIDSDFVLVLTDGRIAEYDTPINLLDIEDSFFSKLIKEYSRKS